MQKRKIAQTGMEVSVLGLGTVKFGRNQGVKYPESFVLPDDAAIQHLLALAKDAGINLLDTAPAYGTSEERLGSLLKGQRHEWLLCTKAGEDFQHGTSSFDFSKAGMISSIERSLTRLNTDYLDIVLVHSSGDDEKIINEDGALDTLRQLRDEGKIRAFGMSTKTVAGGLLALQHSDLVMMTYYPGYTDEYAVIEGAAQMQKGIFIKKALASGHLQKIPGENPVAESMRFILAEPAVTSIVIGTINPAHLLANISAVPTPSASN